MLCFLKIYEDKKVVCGHKILTEGAFVTQLSGNSGFLVRRAVWVAIKFCFLFDFYCICIK